MCLTTTYNSVSNALVVPKELRCKILVAAHDGLGHGGVGVTRSLFNRHSTWPKLLDDIRCDKCQQFNKSGHVRVPLVEAEIVSERGEKFAIDIVGPLPKAKGSYRYIFTCMELAAGYPFTIPIRNFTSEPQHSACCILSPFWVHHWQILSDQGTNFLSITVSLLCKKFGIVKIKTSPCHPQSNRRLKRFHGTLKTMLSKAIDEHSDWASTIDLILYYAHNTPSSRHGFTPRTSVSLAYPLRTLYHQVIIVIRLHQLGQRPPIH